MALLASLGASCDHSGPTDPSARVQLLQPLDSALGAKAGAVVYPRVRVLGAGREPVAGARVSWIANAGGISATSVSDAQGIASARWYAPTQLGPVSLTASAGDAPPLELHADVVANDAAKLDVLDDSVRFTAQRQTRIIRVVGWDAYGHPTAVGDNLGFRRDSDWVGLGRVMASGDTALVELSVGMGTHRGYVRFMEDSVLVVLQPVITRLSGIAGLDTVYGLAVGERATLKVIGVDSLGYEISGVDPGSAGLQVTTSAAGIATVSNDGAMTAVAPGTVTIDASAPGVTYHREITVYPVFDIGTQTAGVELHDGNAYYQMPRDHYLTDAGMLYDLSHYVGAGALPHPEFDVLRAHAADGTIAWTRSYSMGYATVIADPATGIAYLADPLHVIHAITPDGADRWSFDYGAIDTGGCRLAGWKDGVAAACSTHVFALDGSGSLSWSATVSDTAQQVITSPTLTIVRMKGSVAAIGNDGAPAWTMASSATNMIADASSTVYLTGSGVRAIDATGRERWYSATPMDGCILATADRIVVCRNLNVITALDPGDGHVRWSTTSPTSFGSMAAVSGDRVLVTGAYLFAFDARTGAVLGRSLNRVDQYDLAIGYGTLAASAFSFARVFRTSFTPGSEWSQSAGNAGHGNRVSQ